MTAVTQRLLLESAAFIGALGMFVACIVGYGLLEAAPRWWACWQHWHYQLYGR